MFVASFSSTAEVYCAYLEFDPVIDGNELLEMLNVNVAPEQKNRKSIDQRRVVKVDLRVFDLMVQVTNFYEAINRIS